MTARSFGHFKKRNNYKNIHLDFDNPNPPLDPRLNVFTSSTLDALTHFNPLHIRNAQGNLPLGTWQMRGIDNFGTAKAISFQGYLGNFRMSWNVKDSPTGTNLSIRVLSDTVTLCNPEP